MVATGGAGWLSLAVAGCTDSDDGGGGGTTTTGLTVTHQTSTTTGEDTGSGPTTGHTGSTASSTATATTTSMTTTTAAPTTTATGTGDCSSYDRFAPGVPVGFLVGVYDAATGAVLDDGSVASVAVTFASPSVPDLTLQWSGGHDHVAPDRWGGLLEDTDSLPTGLHRYEVVVRPVDGEPVTRSGRLVVADV
ncbi:MAG: hypothetical protein ABEJ42_06705 [Halobacteriaceae archaeon]